MRSRLRTIKGVWALLDTPTHLDVVTVKAVSFYDHLPIGLELPQLFICQVLHPLRNLLEVPLEPPPQSDGVRLRLQRHSILTLVGGNSQFSDVQLLRRGGEGRGENGRERRGGRGGRGGREHSHVACVRCNTCLFVCPSVRLSVCLSACTCAHSPLGCSSSVRGHPPAPVGLCESQSQLEVGTENGKLCTYMMSWSHACHMTSHLDRDDLPVPDDTSQFNHRLHPSNRPLHGNINQLLPTITQHSTHYTHIKHTHIRTHIKHTHNILHP